MMMDDIVHPLYRRNRKKFHFLYHLAVKKSHRDDIILANPSEKASPPSEGCPQDGVGSFHQTQSDGVDAFITTSPP
jgi:hypothetical protein